MRNVVRIILFSFISISIATAQNQLKADSVQAVLQSAELTEIERLEGLFWLSTYQSTPEEKLKAGEELLVLAERSDNEEYVIKANYRIGVAYRFMGNLGKAQEHLFKSANGAIAIEVLRPLLAEIYAEISTTYTQNNDSRNALLYNSKAINILRKTDKRQELAIGLLNTGYDYYLIENYDSAMAYYNESEPILENIGMTLGLAYIMGNRALVYWKLGDTKQAKKDLFKAIEMLNPLGDMYGIADYYNQLGWIYKEEKSASEAIKYATLALQIAKQEGLKEQIRDASSLLFQVYRSEGDYKSALEYQIQYSAYRDSIQNPETTRLLASLKAEFELGQKQAELDTLLEQKKLNQRILMIAGIVILLLSIVIIYFLVSGSQKQSE